MYRVTLYYQDTNLHFMQKNISLHRELSLRIAEKNFNVEKILKFSAFSAKE